MSESVGLKKIYVVFKTHFDIGFTGFVSDVVGRYRSEMLKQVIDICEQTKHNAEHEKYVWTMSSWPLLQSIEGSGEDDWEKARGFLQNRQLIWHMLPFTTHTEFCGLEEWIRGMYISRSLTEQFGYEPKDAKMTDVPGHTWIVPSLLKKAGVQILHLGCNGFSTPPDVPPVFFWEGPDGERLLTFYSKGSYGTGILPPDDWSHPVWLAMIQTSDNHGPHEASIVEEMKASIKDKGLQAELHIGSLTDFAEDFLSRNPDLPVVRGDLADAWIHGVGTAPREVSRVRELRGRITAAESALALSMLLSGDTVLPEAQKAKRLLDESYEHTLLFGEHTWGMDCKTFLFPRSSYEKKQFLQNKQSERYMRMEHSWQEQIDYLNRAESSLVEAVAAFSAGGGRMDHVHAKNALRVYNSLGWSRDALVELEQEQLPKDGQVWVDCATGETLRVRDYGGKAHVEVKGLPALGYKTIAYAYGKADGSDRLGEEAQSLLHASLDEREAVLENEFYTVKVCRRTGWIVSLYDKQLGKEWIEQRLDADSEGAPAGNPAYGFGQYEYNIYSSEEITRYIKKYAYRFYDWGVHDFGKTDYPEAQKRLSYSTVLKDLHLIQEHDFVRVECTAGADPESVAAYGNAREITWSITLTRKPGVDMEWQLHGKEETPLAESGHILFPLKLDNPSYRINKMGSVIDPCADIVPSASTLLYCCEHFVDVSDGEAGMAIVPLDTPLLFIGRNGMWDFEHDYKPEKPELNFNLFNNWWGTNFPQWVGGELKFRYRLIPHQGDWRDGSVWQAAQEAMTQAAVLAAGTGVVPEAEAQGNSSLAAAEIAAGAALPGGTAAPASLELLPVGLEGMSITCFKPAEDGDGFILRLRDWHGEAREVVVCFADLVDEVRKTDLLEYGGEALPFAADARHEGKKVRFRTAAFEVHTLRIRC